jgi:hypothetical protein
MRDFTDRDLVAAMERCGVEVLTLDRLDEWPEPTRSQMKAAIALAAKNLADAIDDGCIASLQASVPQTVQ